MMKNIFITAAILTLAGCQSTIPEQPEILNQSNYISSKSLTSIIPLSSRGLEVQNDKQVHNFLENDKNKEGPYPLQYKYIISNHLQKPVEPLFKPIAYNTGKQEKGWGTCVNIDNTNHIFIIKNNKIIETFSGSNTDTVCNSLKITQEQKDNEQYRKNVDNAVAGFKAIVDDPEKSSLFGTAPVNPEKFILQQLPIFLNNESILEDISVRKTFQLVGNESVYCYLIYAKVLTKDSQGNTLPEKKAIFFYKDGYLLNHKIFDSEKTSAKGEILKNKFDEQDLAFSESFGENRPLHHVSPPKKHVSNQTKSSSIKKSDKNESKNRNKIKATPTKKEVKNDGKNKQKTKK